MENNHVFFVSMIFQDYFWCGDSFHSIRVVHFFNKTGIFFVWASLDKSGLVWASLASLGQFKQVWASLHKSGPHWANLGHFGQVWATLGKSGPLWASLGHFWQDWACLGN